MQEPKILFFLAVWKRPEITELCFMGLKRLMNARPGTKALAVISEKEMIPLCEKYSIDYVEHENEPLGKKKNFGLNHAMKKDWDYLIELGSDDVILNSIFDAYAPLMKAKEDYFGFNRVLYIDAVTKDCRDYTAVVDQYGYGFGLGRCLSRKLVESVSGNIQVKGLTGVLVNGELISDGSQSFLPPEKAEELEKLGWIEIVGREKSVYMWTETANRVLDNDSNERIRNKGFKYKVVETQTAIAADIKSDENIWGYNPEIGTVGHVESFLSKLSKEEKAKFIDNQKKLRAKRIERAA